MLAEWRFALCLYPLRLIVGNLRAYNTYLRFAGEPAASFSWPTR